MRIPDLGWAAVVAYLLARGIAAVLSDRKRNKSERDSK